MNRHSKIATFLTAAVLGMGSPNSASAHGMTNEMAFFMGCWMMAVDEPSMQDKVQALSPEWHKLVTSLSGEISAQTRACYRKEKLWPTQTCQRIIDATLANADSDALFDTVLQQALTPKDVAWISSPEFDKKAMACVLGYDDSETTLQPNDDTLVLPP